MSDSKRYHLVKQRYPEVYYIVDIEKDSWGAMHDGKISRMDTEDIVQANTFKDLLLTLRADESMKWYCVNDWLGSDGKYRHDEYPHFQTLHPLRGYIEEVCDIRFDDKPYTRDWQLDYISEIWVKTDESHFAKVRHYEEKIVEIVKEKAEQIKEQKNEVN